MPETAQSGSIGQWLADVRESFAGTPPALAALFETYAAEAVFGRRYIDTDLAQLKTGARLVEIGAGSLLLSCQLVREGFQVTAVEPTGSGFTHFEQMRQLILQRASALGCLPRMLNLAAEELAMPDSFDYAFSVNVMEHVNDVARVIASTGDSLVVGASYRFTCPNYLFPYEPHFNMPTLFSRSLTWRILGRRMMANRHLPDPAGTWASLNWINVPQVSRIASRLPWLQARFNRQMLVSTFERIATDPGFAQRRSPLVRRLILWMVGLRLHRLLGLLPATVQPIMDCSFQKITRSGVH